MSKENGAGIIVDGLIRWGVDTIFGLPGDGINGIMEAIRHRAGRVRFIQVRHEESAAFMACAHAKLTGKLGCCLATTGPGGLHLLNGLYDAKADGAPVIAVTGLPYHDLINTFTQQDVDHSKVFADVAHYTTQVLSPAHAENVVNLACRTALTYRGVAHLAVPMDVQEEPAAFTYRSDRDVPHHALAAPAKGFHIPFADDLERAADLLNDARRVVILVGQGARGARDELLACADLLAAPIVKALLGKDVVPDNHPHCLGCAGILGTRASQEALEACDALLIVGSTFPYIEFYPDPRKVKGVQIDINPPRIGLRFPVEVGLVGEAKATLELLGARLRRKGDRSFLERMHGEKQRWQALLKSSLDQDGPYMKAGAIALELSHRLSDDAIVTWDSGQNTSLVARFIEARPNQRFVGSGLLASMGSALTYAAAAALCFPDRQVVAIAGDGGLSMLLGELATLVRYNLPVKIIVIKNNALGQIKWEQMMLLGNPPYEVDLTPIDFLKVAEGFGIKAWSVVHSSECAKVLDEALQAQGPALIEATVDPAEPLLPPKRYEKYARNFQRALNKGGSEKEAIEDALKEEPAASLFAEPQA